MSLPVDLCRLAQELVSGFSETRVYLNRRTGESFPVSDEEWSFLERWDAGEGDEESLPGGQIDLLPALREIRTSGHRLLERFAQAQENTAHADALLRTLNGRGAFRRFKDVAYALGLLEAWYDYHQTELEARLAAWLDVQGVPYTRER